MRCDGALSNSFKVERREKQGCVPAGDGPFAEATGDIRTLATSIDTLNAQVAL